MENKIKAKYGKYGNSLPFIVADCPNCKKLAGLFVQQKQFNKNGIIRSKCDCGMEFLLEYNQLNTF